MSARFPKAEAAVIKQARLACRELYRVDKPIYVETWKLILAVEHLDKLECRRPMVPEVGFFDRQPYRHRRPGKGRATRGAKP